MEMTRSYEKFPAWIVILSNFVSALIYISGLIITLKLGWIAAVLFGFFILLLEFRLLGRHCINCYYWGKRCGFGKGRLSSLLFKKGNPLKFCDKQMSWKDMIPDLIVSLAPLVIGIVLMIIKFDLLLLFASIMIIVLSTSGNGNIRSKLTCKYCRQRELGCPAEKLFSKE